MPPPGSKVVLSHGSKASSKVVLSHAAQVCVEGVHASSAMLIKNIYHVDLMTNLNLPDR